MVLSLGLMALLMAAPSPALEVEVFVPLCDAALLRCGRAEAGDPHSLEGNLYWGAAYGAERFLARAPGFRVLSRRDGAPGASGRDEAIVERRA